MLVTVIYSITVSHKHPEHHHEMAVGNSDKTFVIPEKAVIIFGWLDWVVMPGQALSVVENDYNRKFSKLKPISCNTFMKYSQSVAQEVDERLRDELPKNFGNWTI